MQTGILRTACKGVLLCFLGICLSEPFEVKHLIVNLAVSTTAVGNRLTILTDLDILANKYKNQFQNVCEKCL